MSPSNPVAVLTFFADTGLDKADVAAAIARKPILLCSRVDETLKPRVTQPRDIGLTPLQISRLIAIVPHILFSPLLISRLAFYLILRLILSQDVQRVVMPNITFLRHCGVADCDILELFQMAPRMLLLEPKRAIEIVSCAEKLGVPRGSAMFKHALASIYNISPRRVSSRSDFLMKALGCSEAEVGIAVCKFPHVLGFSADKISRSVGFLMMEVGLEPYYIDTVRRPSLIGHSLTRILVPRHFVLKALKAKGLVKKDMGFTSAVLKCEKEFIKRFLDPYKESIQGLQMLML